MTITELIEALPSMEIARRTEVLKRLLPMLTETSHATLQHFQDNWDSARPFEEFVQAQNTCLISCLGLELSPLGITTRELGGLSPLTGDTEV